MADDLLKENVCVVFVYILTALGSDWVTSGDQNHDLPSDVIYLRGMPEYHLPKKYGRQHCDILGVILQLCCIRKITCIDSR